MSNSPRGGTSRLLALAGVIGMTLAIAPSADAERLRYTQQTQQQSQWCWAAGGLSIAQFLGAGRGVTQNQFCNMARNLPKDGSCPNQPDLLQTVQRGFAALGVSPGRVTGRPTPHAEVAAQIRSGRPIQTGVYWTQGGGHAQVVFGLEGDKISYADPWPSSPRYSEMPYNSYVQNSRHRWADSLLGMGGQ